MAEPPPHVLVTGSSRGIGAAIADALAGRARYVGHASREGPGVVAADLADPQAAERLWDEALRLLDGRIDVLINNAGVFEPVSVDAPLAEWQAGWARTMQINLRASADLCRRAILHWRERGGGGRIVNVASRA